MAGSLELRLAGNVVEKVPEFTSLHVTWQASDEKSSHFLLKRLLSAAQKQEAKVKLNISNLCIWQNENIFLAKEKTEFYLAIRLNLRQRALSALIIYEDVKCLDGVQWHVVETGVEGDAAERTVAAALVQLVHELLVQHAHLPRLAEIAFPELLVREEAHLLRIPQIEAPVVPAPVPSPGHFATNALCVNQPSKVKNLNT